MSYNDLKYYHQFIGWCFGIHLITAITDYNSYSVKLILPTTSVVLTASEFASATSLGAISPQYNPNGKFIIERHNHFNEGHALSVYKEVANK